MNNNLSNGININIPNGIIVGSNTGYISTLPYQPSGTVFSLYTRAINNPPGTALNISTATKVSDDFIKP